MSNIEITQADRDAAANLAKTAEPTSFLVDLYQSGEWDGSEVIQAFAKHRIQARNAALEEAAKVAEDRYSMFDTLGDRSISSDYCSGHEMGQDYAADEIAAAIRKLI